MSRIIEFDTVRIIALSSSAEAHLVVSSVQRLPRVGDVGTVVHLVPTSDPDDPATRFIVESTEAGARLGWLAEFVRSEIEFVARPG